MKAKLASQARKLVEIPNVGARMAMDFQKMGIKKPDDLKGKNAYALYKKYVPLLRRVTILVS